MQLVRGLHEHRPCIQKQAFSQARQRLHHTAFREAHADSLRVVYTTAPKSGLWKGYRLIGADGSTLRLPESEELASEFRRWETKADVAPSPPMARISEYTDMTTKLVLSGRIAPVALQRRNWQKSNLKRSLL